MIEFARCWALALLIMGVASGCVSPQRASGTNQHAWPIEQRAQIQIDLGMSYLQRGQLEVARQFFNKAKQIDPRSSGAYHGLGLLEARLQNSEKARTHLKKAARLDAADQGIVSDYAMLLCGSDEIDNGLKWLERSSALANNIDSLGMKLAYGHCHMAGQALQKAEQSYQSALVENAELRPALLAMGELKYMTRNYLSARGFLQRYFATGAVSPQALSLAVQVENMLGASDERDRYMRQLSAHYPSSEETKKIKEILSR